MKREPTDKDGVWKTNEMERGKAFISLQKCAECLLSLLWKVTLMLENELHNPSERISFICPAEETIIAGLSTRLIHFGPK